MSHSFTIFILNFTSRAIPAWIYELAGVAIGLFLPGLQLQGTDSPLGTDGSDAPPNELWPRPNHARLSLLGTVTAWEHIVAGRGTPAAGPVAPFSQPFGCPFHFWDLTTTGLGQLPCQIGQKALAGTH